MKKTTLIIRGLAFDLVIVEVNDLDVSGCRLCYIADIYRESKTTNVRQLIRRSRLPETAAAIRRDVERDGIQALRRFVS